MAATPEEQDLLAEIDIAHAGLYVFKDSTEKQKWEEILDKARTEVVSANYIHARKLIDRVKEVVDKLWQRIFRWQDMQRLVTRIFVIVIPLELIGICFYVYFVDILRFSLYTCMIFGLLGGSLGVALNIGKDLQIAGSNRLQMLRLILRPFIGVISAIVLFALIQTKAVAVLPGADRGAMLILLSIFAGFSERFIVKMLSNYIPSTLEMGTKKIEE